jgi:hypothetical protein
MDVHASKPLRTAPYKQQVHKYSSYYRYPGYTGGQNLLIPGVLLPRFSGLYICINFMRMYTERGFRARPYNFKRGFMKSDPHSLADPHP